MLEGEKEVSEKGEEQKSCSGHVVPTAHLKLTFDIFDLLVPN